MEDIPEDYVAEVRQTFRLFDEDDNGVIDIKELGNVFESFGKHYTPDELEEMMAEIDTDGSGVIEFDEFLHLMRRRLRDTDTEEEMVEAFKVFDRDGDGLISLEELTSVMK